MTFFAVAVVMALGAWALLLVASGRAVESKPGVGAASLAESVGPVSADAFAQRGIYLGPPGTIPAGVPIVPVVTPPTTDGSGEASPASGTQPGSEQLAVQGDPANGTASVTAQEAKATTLRSIGGFVGPVTLGTPILVQLDNVYVRIVATAWAIPVTGTVDLSGGPATGPNGGSVAPSAPRTTTAIVFVDAVTGNFISEEGFGNVS